MEKSKELLESFEMLKTACVAALADSQASENSLAELFYSQDLNAEQKSVITNAVSSMRICNKVIKDSLVNMEMLIEISAKVSELAQGFSELNKDDIN